MGCDHYEEGKFPLQVRHYGSYDVVVCGGGVAGVAAAVTAARAGAKVLLLEAGSCLGGILTRAYMPHFIDAANKGGFVREILEFLNGYALTCVRRGNRTDAEGNKTPGPFVDVEGCKFFFDKACSEAGVKVLFGSRVTHASCQGDTIQQLLLSTEAGNYQVDAKLFVDATGNGNLACMAGCGYEVGEPETGKVQPASVSAVIGGYPAQFNDIGTLQEKIAYGKMLEDHGIKTTSGEIFLAKLPSLSTWDLGTNFLYDVMPDDIDSISEAITAGRREVFETVQKHKKIEGYEGMFLIMTGEHIGMREGRRIYGQYRITTQDILEGKRFPDGVCTVTAGVDVHKLHDDDTHEASRGHRSKPYHIPYRSLVALECQNLFLAGRCLSGDFYPHASYRMMGNMTATGQAVGYAAAKCTQQNILPAQLDGEPVSQYMKSEGYEL